MVEYRQQQISDVFRALAHPTRRAILTALAAGPRTVGAVADPFDISLAAVSRHLDRLEHAGLLRRTVRGRQRLCSLEPGPLAAAYDWLGSFEDFRNDRDDAIEDRLARPAD